MPGFGDYLNLAIRSSWSDHYVDYNLVKLKLTSFSKRRRAFEKILSTGGQITEEDLYLASIAHGVDVKKLNGDGDDLVKKKNGAEGSEKESEVNYFQYKERKQIGIDDDNKRVMHRISMIERSEFCSLLDEQMEKAAKFYTSQLLSVADTLSKLNDTNAWDTVDEESSKPFYEIMADEILELMAFVAINILTLRQSLIRYDGYVRTSNGLPLSNWYFTNMSEDSQDALLGLFHLDALFALQHTYSLHIQEAQILYKKEDGDNSTTHPSVAYMNQFHKEMEQFTSLLEKSFYRVEKAASGRITFRDRVITNIRHYFFLGTITRSLAYQPNFLRIKGKHLKAEMKIIVKWRDTKKMPSEEVEEFVAKIDPKNIFPLVLNLLSCFLYMMGSYIIEPSSAYYASALGSSDAMAGMVIGINAWAALFAAVAFSFWTNVSYKQPIIVAGCMSIVGHYLYASALRYNSIEMCLLGRSIVGLGSPRVINRRYIADATPFAIRSAATAAFGMATAIGAALGPAFAIILDYFHIETELPFIGKFYFNGMTGPGYFMSCAWFIYLIMVIFGFSEPYRSGLEELKRREANRASLNEGLLGDDDSTVMTHDSQHGESNTKAFDMTLKDTEEAPGGITPTTLDGNNSIATSTLFSATSSPPENSVAWVVKHITPPVYLCMILVFLKRIVLECVMASTSIVTKNRYGWSTKSVGLLHFINGTLIIPLCMLAGFLSLKYEDRYMTIWCMSFTLLGVTCLIDFTDLFDGSEDGGEGQQGYNSDNPFSVGPVQYIAGSLIAFAAVEVNESFIASLLSKVVPSALATGTINSGLLMTLVGTSGRAVGDFFITTMGYISIRYLLNLVAIPAFFFVLTSIYIVRTNYDILYEL